MHHQRDPRDPKTAPKTFFALPLASERTGRAAQPEKKPTSSVFRQQDSHLNAYEKHQRYVAQTSSSALSAAIDAAANSTELVSEKDILKQHYRFLRGSEPVADNKDPEAQSSSTSWEARVAKKYEDQLFREFCLADMSRYEEGKIAMRWRTKSEVLSGKGKDICGNVACSATADLKSWEVNFAYMEDGVRKNALVKLCVCPECTYKLHYRKIQERKLLERQLRKQQKNEQKSKKRRKKDVDQDSDESNGTDSDLDNQGANGSSHDLESSSDGKQSSTLATRTHSTKRAKAEEIPSSDRK
eukprot:jgi/Hompol1/5334/HPOL_001944-RA